MKKHFLIIFLILTMVLLLVGCNMSLTPGNYMFKIVHISDASGNSADFEISSWHESETPGIEVKLTDGNSLFLSEGTYILAEDYCPLCEDVSDG